VVNAVQLQALHSSLFCVALPGHANFLEVSFQEECERIAPGAELKYDLATQRKIQGSEKNPLNRDFVRLQQV
jgi:hypothetical protein